METLRLPPILSTKFLGTYLDVDPKTLRYWRSRYSMPYRKLGKRVYYDRDEVHEWFEANFPVRVDKPTAGNGGPDSDL